MYKYVFTIAITIIVLCLYLPTILSGLTAWSDRRWDRRQERYDWRQDKKEDRFWRRGGDESDNGGESEEDEETQPEEHRQWRRFRAN